VAAGPVNYRFVETSPPAGYYLNSTPVPFSISPFSEGPPVALRIGTALVNYKGTARFQKDAGQDIGGDLSSAGTHLEGAVFQLLYGDAPNAGKPVLDGSGNVVTIISDEDGVVLVPNLAPGRYYQLIEAAPPAGYIQNNAAILFRMPSAQTVIASADDLIVYTHGEAILNFLGSSYFTKYGQSSMDDGDRAPVEGAVYALYRMEGGQRGAQVTNTEDKDYRAVGGSFFVSNPLGNVTTSSALEPGDYEFVELIAPPGYILDPTPIPFEIGLTEPNHPDDIALPCQVNYTGAALFSKTNEAAEPLASAGFDVVRVLPEGMQGPEQVVSHVSSGADGAVLADGLAPGDYAFAETKAPDGYIRNTEPLAFTIPAAAEGAPEVVTENADGPLTQINYTGAAVLKKVAENSEETLLAGAVFDLLDGEGKALKTGLTTGGDGTIRAEDLAPGGYAFVETKAPDGYELDATPVAFTIPDAAPGAQEALRLTKANIRIPASPNTGDPFAGGVYLMLLLLCLCGLAVSTFLTAALCARDRSGNPQI
jgi:uncharacterized surface anchored protein